MPTFTIIVNRTAHRVDADPAMPLLWVLRDRLNLTGTKYGCGAGLCGACTVLHDDHAVRSCTLTIAAADGQSYTTIEGLSADATHPCQRAWIDEDVAQCGYCQPARSETAARCAREGVALSADIDHAIAGRICRCGTCSCAQRRMHEVTRRRSCARRLAGLVLAF
jgi:aerobic-type carbon monoxide dehydrogenase small subunit (CoxS/CutS family)